MLAFAKKTDLADQLGVADQLMANLQKRAASLPGTTQEYVNMLGQLAQPITDAGLSLQDLEDISVNATVGAKAWKLDWEASARDVAQALRGTFHSNDQFTGLLLGSIGYKGEEGRANFNALSAQKRGAEIKRALTQKQLSELAAAQGQTARGKLSTLQDTASQVIGKVTAPLFAKLVGYLEQVNLWLDKNSDKVKGFADTVGGVLTKALGYVIEAVQFLSEHPDLAIGLGAVLAVLLLLASPVALIVAGVVLLILLIKKLGPFFEAVGRLMKRIFDWLVHQFKVIGDGIIALGRAIAAPFIAAADLIKSVWSAVYDWVSDKYEWVKSKIEWIEDKANKVKIGLGFGDQVTGSAAQAAQDAANRARNAPGVTTPSVPSVTGWIPSVSAPGTTTIKNDVTVSPTITVNPPEGSSTDGMANMVTDKISEMWRDAHDSLRGGRR
jgi:hypothetical protein